MPEHDYYCATQKGILIIGGFIRVIIFERNEQIIFNLLAFIPIVENDFD
jgi:hypothetical protein